MDNHTGTLFYLFWCRRALVKVGVFLGIHQVGVTATRLLEHSHTLGLIPHNTSLNAKLINM